jgi:outer membrane protein, multidrug efflux system
VKIILLFLLCFALLAGCRREPVQLRHPPDLTPPAEWTADGPEPGEVVAEWWRTFEDPTLDDLVRRAVEGNHNLQAAAARVRAAAAQARVVSADLLPTVNASLDGARRRQNFIGLPIPGAADRVLSTTFTTFGVSLGTSWEVDVWGRLSAGEAAALADLQAGEAEFLGARLSLSAQTAKAWFSVVEALGQVELSERTVSTYRETAARVRARYEAGLQSSLDVRLALSSLASAEALLTLRRQQLDLGRRQLEILLGEYPAALLTVSAELPALPPLPPAGVPSDLVARRPDLVSAERRLLASDARWHQARRNLYPRFGLTGSAGTSSRELLELLDGEFFVWSILGNLIQPVFDRGRLRAQVELADARSHEALATYANAILTAFSEVETALSAERFLEERVAEVALAAQQSAASQNLALDRYGAGLEQFVTVLEAQRRSLSAESELLTLRRQQLEARVNLHLALGGGFETESGLDSEMEEQS